MIKNMRHIFRILTTLACLMWALASQGAGAGDLYCRISMIYVNDTIIYTGEGDVPGNIVLGGKNNKIKIAVMGSGADSDSLGTVEYTSRLMSHNDEWAQWSTQREYTYCRLGAGSYTFQVKARIEDIAITEPVTMTFEAKGPFWESGYGLLAMLLILAALMCAAAWWTWKRENAKRLNMEATLNKCMDGLKDANEKLQNQQETHNKNIQVLSLLSKAGQNIIKNFTLKEIYRTTYDEINKFFETDNIGIGTYNAPHNSIDFRSFIINGESMPFARYKLDYEDIMEVYCYLNSKTIVLDDYQKQISKYINPSLHSANDMISGSAVYMPLFDNEMTIGVLTIHNNAANFFNSYHLGIIHNIASYLETAIVNYYTDRKAKRRQKLLEDRTIVLQKTNNDLERSQAQLQTMSVALTNTENSVVILDKDRNLIWGNIGFCKIFGYDFYEYIKDNAYYMEAIRQKEAIPYFTNAYERIEPSSFSLPHINKNGQEVWTQTNITPITDKNGKLLQIVAVDTDISSLKQAEQEITNQRNEIEAKNKDLTKSIEYASTIQSALMTGRTQLQKNFRQSFLMLQPKDIVSGDFFWMGEKFGRKYLALCDCAGHGVPGAFLSMMGKVFLDEILQSLKVEDTPSTIIRKLNDKLYTSINGLSSKVGGIDGMDTVMCMINSRHTFIIYAGAYRPLYLVKNGELQVIGPDKCSTGNLPPDNDFQWEDHSIQVSSGDFVLMCSDGYSDQFGQENGKKLGRRNFTNLILEASKMDTAQEMEQFFMDSHRKWKGCQEQVDDISIAGIKITPITEESLSYEEDEED